MRKGELIALRPGAAVDEVGDAGLVAACATGDRAARALLFERHVGAVHRFVTRMRGSDGDAVDDLVQATFLAAFGAAARFRGDSARSWLYGIAAHQTASYARREIRRKRALTAAVEMLPHSASGGDPYLRVRLPQAIAALPHELRAPLVLIDLEGERGIDAAAALGIPEGTLWRRVFHARRALRAALAGGEP